MSGIALVALCAATIFQLVRIQPHVADGYASSEHVDTGLLFADLQRTGSAGLLSASRREIELRIPAAVGVVCATGNGGTTLAALPVQPGELDDAAITAIGWPDRTGAYAYAEAALQTSRGAAAMCAAAGITPPADARVLTVATSTAGPHVGSTAVLFARVVYRFRPAAEYPRSTALWRVAGGSERMLATISTDAMFRFFVDAASNASTDVPAPLSRVRGVEVHLPGESGAAVLPTAAFFHPQAD